MVRFVIRYLKERFPQVTSGRYQLVIACVTNPFVAPSAPGSRIWYATAIGNAVRVGTAIVGMRGLFFRKVVVKDLFETTIASDEPAEICTALGIAGPIPRHTRWTRRKQHLIDSSYPWLVTDVDGSQIVYYLDEIGEAEESHAFFDTFTRKLSRILAVHGLW